MLFAVHISDGVLSLPVCLSGFAVLLPLLIIGWRKMDEQELPRIAFLSAMFFVVTLIHIRVGGTTVHLLLSGLIGIVLGSRAAIAITLGLVLQALLLGHGGLSTLGINGVVIALPTILFRRVIPERKLQRDPFKWGCFCGAWGALSSSLLNAVILITAGITDLRAIAVTMLIAGLVLAVIEGVITGTILQFLVRVRSPILNFSQEIPPLTELPTDQSQHSL